MSIKKVLFLLLLLFPLNVFALNKAPINITTMDITDLSEALNDKIITSEDLVNLYLDRINTYNKNYNAIITINNEAIKEAQKLDKERLSGKVRSILHGIPIIVKDNIDVYGMPTTGGSSYLSDNYPKTNSTAIQKLIDAGAIIIGKANMSKFALVANSSVSDYGTVKNAYNLDYSSYGSSGGSAVSTAVSFAAASLGTDTNSSVRVPASANNVIGFRPTIGLISRTGILPYDTERDTIGTITKDVSDTIILTNILNGYDSSDNKSINQKKQTYQITKNSLKGYTLGIPSDFLKGSNDNTLSENKETYNEIYDLMLDAIKSMKKDGAKIVYLDDYYNTNQNYLVSTSYSGFLFCDSFNKYLNGTTGSIRSFEALNALEGDLTNYQEECNSSISLDTKNARKQTYKEYINNIMDTNKLDAIFYPTTKNKLLKVDNTGVINLSAHAASTIGYPAITIPLGFDSDGLAYGIEFMTKSNQENILFNIAYNYEQNNVTITSPSIAPNLYKIPLSVNTLVKNYHNVLYDNINTYLEKLWLKKVQNFFKNYNKNSNISKNANKLNDEYNRNKILNIFFYLIVFIFIFVIFSNLKITKKRKK